MKMNALYMNKERISELEAITVETSRTEKQRQKTQKEMEQKQNNSMLTNLIPR